MLNIAKIQNKLSELVKSTRTKKLPGKRPGLLLVIVLLFIALVIYSIIFFVSQPKISCGELVEQNKESYKKALNDPQVDPAEFYKEKYASLDKEGAPCDGSKKFLGLVAADSKDNLSQIQFYYERASFGYMTGKTEEAKKDAIKALEINKKLSDSEKTLENHSQIVQELEYIRDGTY